MERRLVVRVAADGDRLRVVVVGAAVEVVHRVADQRVVDLADDLDGQHARARAAVSGAPRLVGRSGALGRGVDGLAEAAAARRVARIRLRLRELAAVGGVLAREAVL